MLSVTIDPERSAKRTLCPLTTPIREVRLIALVFAGVVPVARRVPASVTANDVPGKYVASKTQRAEIGVEHEDGTACFSGKA